jgi:tripartite-type tricarboxylate transporter receptor subunit TctC
LLAGLAHDASVRRRMRPTLFRGKTVRVIVGTSAGGGFDTYARIIAEHLAKYLPGRPTVIVQNMAGAVR